MAFFDSTEDTDLDDDFPRRPVAHDIAQRDSVAAQWRAQRLTREALNSQGMMTARLDSAWQPLVARDAKSSGGSLTVAPDGRLTAGGTLPVGVHYTLTFPAVPGLTALRLQMFPDNDDPKTLTRIAQYEMAFRMQVAAADAFDLTREPPDVHALYGTQPGRESFANNCLLARRLAEHGVRFIQLFDWGWGSHGAGKNEALNHGFKDKCQSIDRACYALLTDLKQRGLLDDTLVIWGGEFGRTPMRENRNGVEMAFIGRDHNPDAFTLCMAGGGVKPGLSYGSTDDFGYQSVIDRVSVHDFHATVLGLLGFDHMRFTYTANGVAMRLSNVTKPGNKPVTGLMA